MHSESVPTMWTIQQTAKALAVSETTVRRCLKRGLLEGYKLRGRVLIPERSILEMLQRHPYRSEQSNGANSHKKTTLLSRFMGR